eukprot:gene14004-biopygen5077
MAAVPPAAPGSPPRAVLPRRAGRGRGAEARVAHPLKAPKKILYEQRPAAGAHFVRGMGSRGATGEAEFAGERPSRGPAGRNATSRVCRVRHCGIRPACVRCRFPLPMGYNLGWGGPAPGTQIPRARGKH